VNKKRFKNVLVVLGGISGERAVSLDSGKACFAALKKNGYNVSTVDHKFKKLKIINKKNK
jgi:D-alanine-D-alanine ligase-like ATP-grasp enzyme